MSRIAPPGPRAGLALSLGLLAALGLMLPAEARSGPAAGRLIGLRHAWHEKGSYARVVFLLEGRAALRVLPPASNANRVRVRIEGAGPKRASLLCQSEGDVQSLREEAGAAAWTPCILSDPILEDAEVRRAEGNALIVSLRTRAIGARELAYRALSLRGTLENPRDAGRSRLVLDLRRGVPPGGGGGWRPLAGMAVAKTPAPRAKPMRTPPARVPEEKKAEAGETRKDEEKKPDPTREAALGRLEAKVRAFDGLIRSALATERKTLPKKAGERLEKSALKGLDTLRRAADAARRKVRDAGAEKREGAAEAALQAIRKTAQEILARLRDEARNEAAKAAGRAVHAFSTCDPSLLNAETDCPLFVDFSGGVEIIGSDSFAETFPRAALRLRSNMGGKQKAQHGNYSLSPADHPRRLSGVLEAALSSRNIEEEVQAGAPGETRVNGTKTLEIKGGFMVDLLTFRTEETEENCRFINANREKLVGVSGDACKKEKDKAALPTHVFALLGELGAIDAQERRGDSSRLLQNHFLGLRLYYRGPGRFNGASADLGWGVSKAFRVNQKRRFKFRGYLPFKREDGGPGLFAGISLDTDLARGEDEVKIFFGGSIALEEILRFLGIALPRRGEEGS